MPTIKRRVLHSPIDYKGKIERFFRTVREQFLDSFEDREPESLAELNRRWQLWLQQEYHRASHRGLEGRTPLEA